MTGNRPRQQEWLQRALDGQADRNRERQAERQRRQRAYGPLVDRGDSLKRGDRVQVTDAAAVWLKSGVYVGKVLRTWQDEDGTRLVLVARDGVGPAETWSANCWERIA